MSEQEIDIASIRQEYLLAALDEETAGENPLLFFKKWFADATAAQVTEVNAMSLATVSAQLMPHVRIVLLKSLEDRGFVFFTNYESTKGRDIETTPQAALLFFWKELERQVRIEGHIEKIPESESDVYFHSRPAGSRLGAWASPQSSEIQHRNILDINYSKYEAEFSGIQIPRPTHWGGYVVIPEKIEFWQGRASRMHDRILFTKSAAGSWHRSRLAP